jgi:beta-N-acetylhexosaminidase
MKKTLTEDTLSDPSQNRHAPAAPPRRSTPKRRRAPFTRSQKLVIALALAVAVVAAIPLGTYLAMKISQKQHPQAQSTSTTTPAASPTASATQRETKFINQMISQMSLAEELGQMLIVEWDASSFGSDLQYMIVNQHVSGTILYGTSVEGISQAAALNAASQANARIPLFVSIDQEGGCVNRLGPITGYRPSARQIGASNDPSVAYQQGVSDAQILKEIGVNLDLAPVVDVQTVSDDAINAVPGMDCFGTRMYGTTAEQVATYAGAYLNGLEDHDIIGSLKHFPGLGADDTVDPHDAVVVLNHSKTDLNKIDFAPYRMLLAQGNVDMIMTTHELVPAYDPHMPATLSPILVSQVLRGDLGFQGVIVTDTLHMGAITNPKPAGLGMTMPQAAVLAVIAGNDLLLGPWNPTQTQAMLDALTNAVTSGQITKARIDLSVQRILALKIKYGLLKIPANFS